MASKKEKSAERAKRVVIGLDDDSAKMARRYQAKLMEESGGEKVSLSDAIKIAVEKAMS